MDSNLVMLQQHVDIGRETMFMGLYYYAESLRSLWMDIVTIAFVYVKKHFSFLNAVSFVYNVDVNVLPTLQDG